MSAISPETGELERFLRLLVWGAITSLVLMALSLVPDLTLFLPSWIRRHPVEWAAAAILACYFLARAIVNRWHGRALWIDWLEWGLGYIEAASRRILESWLAIAFAVIAVLWLLTWLPHYPYWPWCRDTDSYALMAQEWDCGVLPYRDIRSFNFPGHIYLHWILGKLFGWGHTGPFYALDAAILLVFGAVLITWSRRCLGSLLPGVTSYLIFLAYYLDISFENVAERDWHSPLLATLGILMLEAWPGRLSRWLSAFLAAVAFTIRPNVVLFLPALVIAVLFNEVCPRDASPADSSTTTPKRAILAALEWMGLFVGFAVVGFALLFFNGLLDDLARGLGILRRGGPYSNATTERSLKILLEELRQPGTSAVVLGLLPLAARSSDRNLKVLACTWLVALAGALAYRPIHPMDHAYLKTPLALIVAVAWSIPIDWLGRAATSTRRIGFAILPAIFGILLIVYESIPVMIPRNCSVRVSFDSLRAAATGGWPVMPPGAWIGYSPERSSYNWDAYCRLLKYLRENTDSTTIVANVLRNPPFPSTNGAVGRRSPFRVESGVPWMWVVAENLDDIFADQLEALGCNSVVVWSPKEVNIFQRLPLEQLTRVIRSRYAPEVRFDRFEIWRRKCSATQDGEGTKSQSSEPRLPLSSRRVGFVPRLQP
jgi:hypothetical protein